MMNKAFTFRISKDMAKRIDDFCVKLRDYYGYERSRTDVLKCAVLYAIRTKCRLKRIAQQSRQSASKLEIDLKIVPNPLLEKNVLVFLQNTPAECIRVLVDLYLKEQCSRLKPPPPLKESALREAEYLAGQHREFAALCLSLGVNPNCIQEVQP